MEFQWNPLKALGNLKKHGVDFEDAVTAFTDPHGLRISDPDHSADEERYLLLGMTWDMRILVVSHCYRSGSDSIRIISARTATGRERDQYRKGRP